jgi:hypothetical protein
MQGSFPPELSATPLEDIDSFYANQRVSREALAKLIPSRDDALK